MKFIMRFFFCLVPAILVALAAFGITGSGKLGLIALGAMMFVGWDVTQARPERGERP